MNLGNLNCARLNELIANSSIRNHIYRLPPLSASDKNPLTDDKEMDELSTALVLLAIVDVDNIYNHIFYDDDICRRIKSVFKALVIQQCVVVPHPKDMFNAFKNCNDPKVIIFGQDPYYQIDNGLCRATGHSFDMSNSPYKVSKSMANVYKCLKIDYSGFNVPNEVNLLSWKSQGVLLLNATFTTTVGKARAHEKLWSKITPLIINKIFEISKTIIVIAWGRDANSIKVPNEELVISAPHPAVRSKEGLHNFTHSMSFRMCNMFLKTLDKEEIDWLSISS